MNNSNILDVIKRRSSWRTYDRNSPIPLEILRQLKEYIDSKNIVGPFGNKARFELLKIPETERNKINSDYGTYGFIKGAEYFLAGAIQKNKKVLEDFGYIFEHIVLKATELNIGTCWMAGTFKRSTIAREINLNNEEIIPAISPIGIPSKNRRLLGKFMRIAIRAKVRKPWETLFFTETFEPLSMENLDKPLKNALEMVRLAPSAKNKQPWRVMRDDRNDIHFFIEIDSRSGRVLNYQKLDIGIAMCHFELAMQNFEKNGIWKISNPTFKFIPKNYHYVTSWIDSDT